MPVSASLQVLPPTVFLRVTENIPQIIAFIEGIIAHGHAYSTASGMAGGPWWSSEAQVTSGLCAPLPWLCSCEFLDAEPVCLGSF